MDPLAQPVLDYRVGINPVDFDQRLPHVRLLRKILATPTMRRLGAVETAPGTAAQSGAYLVNFVKESVILSFQHLCVPFPSAGNTDKADENKCCTAAMLPKDKGGVVGPDLKVDGVPGLRVVDMSIVPLLVGLHFECDGVCGWREGEILHSERTEEGC